MHEPSTCGFVSADSGMLGGSRPGPVIRHGFEMAGRVGTRSGPVMGPSPAERPLGRSAGRAQEAEGGGRRVLRPHRGAGKAGGGASRGARPADPFECFGPGRAHRGRAGESFSENVLASAGEFPYSTSSHGGVAQLGERLTGSQEVRGSIPLVSTRAMNEAPTQVGAFFHID